MPSSKKEKVPMSDKWVNCPSCGGVGLLIYYSVFKMPVSSGVCPTCKGTGRIKDLDEGKVSEDAKS